MSEADTIRGLDEAMAAQLAAGGFGDDAQYRATALADPVACFVLLDRGVESVGEIGQVTGRRTEITFLAPLFVPVRDARITVGDETWVLERLIVSDDSASTWAGAKVSL